MPSEVDQIVAILYMCASDVVFYSDLSRTEEEILEILAPKIRDLGRRYRGVRGDEEHSRYISGILDEIEMRTDASGDVRPIVRKALVSVLGRPADC